MKEKLVMQYGYCIRYYIRRGNKKESFSSEISYDNKLIALTEANKKIQQLLSKKCKLYELRITKKPVPKSVIYERKIQDDIKPNEVFVKKGSYIRYNKKYGIEEILSKYNPDTKTLVEIDGHMMEMFSHRYANFKFNGTVCKHCGIQGLYFYKERHYQDKNYHFNLYGVDSEGNEVLMTKDHIIAKSKGGKDVIENYQCLCEQCNSRKGSMPNEEFMKTKKEKVDEINENIN